MNKIEEIKFLIDAYYAKKEENDKDNGASFLNRLKTLLLTGDISSDVYELFKSVLSNKKTSIKNDIIVVSEAEVSEVYTFSEAMKKVGFIEHKDPCGHAATTYTNPAGEKVTDKSLIAIGWKTKAGVWFPPAGGIVKAEKIGKPFKPVVSTSDPCTRSGGSSRSC